MPLSVDGVRRLPARRSLVRLTAIGVTAGVAVAAVATAGAGPAGAAAPISRSEGRFLTGTAAGQSFDSVAALQGEMASYPDDPGPNQNDLSGSVLGQALSSPFKNVSVPFPGGVTFGAVGQYAQANKDGSASASSGLIGSNGAINIGGSGNGDVATIDLANLPGATSLTNVLGDLTLTVGAVSGHAEQAAFGKKLADPSADCTGGTYKRVSDPDQAGSYQFANLTLAATSPLLQTLGTTLTTSLATLIRQFAAAANVLGVVTITGLPSAADLASDLSVSLADGGITASLADGSVKIDLAKILTAAGLDINNLCPNTSLVPYLAAALAKLPAALDTLVKGLTAKLNTSLGKTVIKIAGVPLSATALTALITPVITALTSNLSTVTTALDAALQPAIDAVSKNLLDLTANAQEESGGVFTEAALRLSLIPNGGSLPTVPGVPTFPTASLPTSPVNNAAQKPGRSRPAASGSATPNSFSSVKLASARHAVRPYAVAAAGTPVLQLNLALAAVTNDAPTAVSTPTPTTSVPGTSIPTGVPAGAAGRQGGGSPALPIVLVLIGLVLAGGGVTAYRVRIQRGRGTLSH